MSAGTGGELTPSVSLGNYSWNEVDIKNTPGSTAGSGSGDFHQYRMQRRKEMFRLANLDKQAKHQEIQVTYQALLDAKKDEAEAVTAKKSAKRKAKKEKQKHSKIRKKWEAALAQNGTTTPEHDKLDKKGAQTEKEQNMVQEDGAGAKGASHEEEQDQNKAEK